MFIYKINFIDLFCYVVKIVNKMKEKNEKIF